MDKSLADSHVVPRWVRVTLALVPMLGGCATVDQPKPPAGQVAKQPSAVAQVETDHSGFTVNEMGKVDSDVRADFDAAVKDLQTEDYQKAIELLTKVIQRAPVYSAPYINLAIAYEKTGNLTAAEDNLKKALEINPTHPVANNEYGLLYRRTGRFADARAAYEKTLDRYPTFLPARKNLAILCDLYLKDFDCALKNYQIYAAAVPDDKAPKIWIADVEKRAGH
jgi:Tfp pilus assembly protein PilF